jgi:uncharacterized protein with FMN-binding domain
VVVLVVVVVVVVAVVLDGAGSPYASTQYDMPTSKPVHEAVMDGFYTAASVSTQPTRNIT